MSLTTAFMVPIILFIIIVLPIWIPLHYRHLSKSKDLSDEDRQLLDEVLTRAELMAERVETLEKILDAEAPHWRESDAAQKVVELSAKEQMSAGGPSAA